LETEPGLRGAEAEINFFGSATVQPSLLYFLMISSHPCRLLGRCRLSGVDVKIVGCICRWKFFVVVCWLPCIGCVSAVGYWLLMVCFGCRVVFWAYIQRRGYIFAWIVILSVYGADTIEGCYSETGFHIGMDRNCVCLWHRHNCRSQVIDLYLSALIS
jgi:hypothetical protein